MRRTPKRWLEGQWGHSFPNDNDVRPGVVVDDWDRRLLRWLDFWLKGLGPQPPRIGRVDYQDSSEAWHTTTAWPPADARGEVLYLTSSALSPRGRAGSRTFHAVASDLSSCAEMALPPEARRSLMYVSEPVREPVTIAGNPFALLRITSDLPGGLVSVFAFDLDRDARCEGGSERGNLRLITLGTADLRFHTGTLRGSNFPTGRPVAVRVDLPSIAEVLRPGHRLALVVAGAEYADRSSQPYTPRITVHSDGGALASHIVLPIVKGTMNGKRPSVRYPPRPFVPAR